MLDLPPALWGGGDMQKQRDDHGKQTLTCSIKVIGVLEETSVVFVPCQLYTGTCYLGALSKLSDKSMLSCSGGNMAAWLKLKGVDGRAPPGVERAA